MAKFNTTFFNKNLGCFRRYKAFTLAEVLITLGIIGVVAAMTIPTLMNKTNDAEFKTALKKAYSTLNQVSQRAAFENGGSLAGFDTLPHISASADTNSEYFMEMFLAYVNPVKVCYTGDTSCSKGEIDYKTHDGSAWPAGWIVSPGTFPAIVLNDGSIWYFWAASTNCDSDRITDRNNCCGHIRVDTNGFKLPNKTASDFWEFEVGAEGRIVPMGSSADKFKDDYAVTFGYNPIMTNWLMNK